MITLLTNVAKPHGAFGSKSDCRLRGCEFDPSRVPFVEFDHEVISTFILIPLIQDGLLSGTSESTCM